MSLNIWNGSQLCHQEINREKVGGKCYLCLGHEEIMFDICLRNSSIHNVKKPKGSISLYDQEQSKYHRLIKEKTKSIMNTKI